jgi:hypothetical protein
VFVSEFLRILVEIEKRSEPPSRGIPISNIFGATPLPGATPETFATEEIVATYLHAGKDRSNKETAAGSKHRDAESVEQYDAAAFAKDLCEAQGNRLKLKALRRKVAWRLHPDLRRSGICATPLDFAKFNAEIDAAIAKCDV